MPDTFKPCNETSSSKEAHSILGFVVHFRKVLPLFLNSVAIQITGGYKVGMSQKRDMSLM